MRGKAGAPQHQRGAAASPNSCGRRTPSTVSGEAVPGSSWAPGGPPRLEAPPSGWQTRCA
eukprot:9078406-Alexandrium_andersonii.AAC.1